MFCFTYLLLQIRHAWCGVRLAPALGTAGSTTGNPSDTCSTSQQPVSNSNLESRANFKTDKIHNTQGKNLVKSCTWVDFLVLGIFNESFSTALVIWRHAVGFMSNELEGMWYGVDVVYFKVLS